MRVAFFHSNKPREHLLAEAFLEGVKRHGDAVAMVSNAEDPNYQYEVACMVGVKSRELYQKHWRSGIHTVYLDKGYSRHQRSGPVNAWEYWRVAVDSHQPTDNYRADCPDDRMKARGWDEFQPWRRKGDHIIFAGSSEKYHAFYNLGDPNEYAEKIIGKIRRHTRKPISYRPKPSWAGALPIDGVHFSIAPETILGALHHAHALVTHGSNACFEAVSQGVPCVVIGNAIARPISSTSIPEIVNPRLATDDERRSWFSYLAYCQYTLGEMSRGNTWEWLRPQIYG